MTAQKFRVWHIPQIPMQPFEVETADLPSAVKIVDVLADYDLFQFENRIKPDYSNASGIQVWDVDAQEWDDVPDEDIEGFE